MRLQSLLVIVAVSAIAAHEASAQSCNSNLVIPTPPPGFTELTPPGVPCSNTVVGGVDCANTTPSIGALCSDGTMYVGTSPDGGGKMFTTRCDYGMTWNGSACVGMYGVRPALFWGTYGITTGLTDTTTGRANTAWLVANDTNAMAAKYCNALVENGYTDWYLPAKDELAKIYAAKNIGGSKVAGTVDITGNYYWSSTEYSSGNAWLQRFSDGIQASTNKNNGFLVRCVRR